IGARRLRQAWLHPTLVIVPPVVHESQSSADPADATFHQSPFEFGETHRRATPDEALESVVHLELDDADNDATSTGTVRTPERVAATDVHAGHQVHVLHRRPQPIPVRQIVRLVIDPGWQHDADQAKLGASFGLGHRPLHRPATGNHAYAFETIGIRLAILGQPVVVGAATGIEIVRIGGTDQSQADARIDNLSGNAIDILIFQPFMGIPAAGPVVGVAKAFGLGNIETLSLQVGHWAFEGQGTWSQPVDDNVVAGLV